jgi:hypothetical protein
MATTPGRQSPVSGRRVLALIAVWLGVVFLAAPTLSLYYETRAAWYVVPPLFLIYAYCLSHPRRATAMLALAATLGVAFTIALAMLIPKATSSAFLPYVPTASDDRDRACPG